MMPFEIGDRVTLKDKPWNGIVKGVEVCNALPGGGYKWGNLTIKANPAFKTALDFDLEGASKALDDSHSTEDLYWLVWWEERSNHKQSEVRKHPILGHLTNQLVSLEGKSR